MVKESIPRPLKCFIPIEVRQSKKVKTGAKIYFGELLQIVNEEGWTIESDGRLASIGGVTWNTLERWHYDLEKAGFIKRVFRRQGESEEIEWGKWGRRKIEICYDAITLPTEET